MKVMGDIAYTQRWLRRHPAEKAFLSLGLLFLAVSSSSWMIHAIIVGVTVWAALASARLPIRSVFKAMAAPMAFLLVGSGAFFVGLNFQDDGGLKIVVHAGAWETALPVMGKALAAVSCLMLFSLTTPVCDALQLCRRCGMPKAVLEAALATYNMFAYLYEVAARMRISQEARLGYANWRISYRSMGLLAANILTQAMARAKRMELGLGARGFTGDLRMLPDFPPVSRRRIVGTAALLLVLFIAAHWR